MREDEWVGTLVSLEEREAGGVSRQGRGGSQEERVGIALEQRLLKVAGGGASLSRKSWYWLWDANIIVGRVGLGSDEGVRWFDYVSFFGGGGR